MKNWKYHFSKCLAVAKVSQKHNSNNENKNICYDKIYVSQCFDILMNTEWNFSFIQGSTDRKDWFDPSTKTEPLGPGPTGFGPWIPAFILWPIMKKPFSDLIFENFSLDGDFKLSQWGLGVFQPIRKRAQFENPPHQNGPLHVTVVWIFLHQTPNSKIFYFSKFFTSGSLPVHFRSTFGPLPVHFRCNSGTFDILKNSCASILLEIFSVPGNFGQFQRVKVLYWTYSSKWPFLDDK